MSLIKCSECGNEVSDKAAACPKCGAPVQIEKTSAKKSSGVGGGFGIFIAVMVLLLLVVLFPSHNKSKVEKRGIHYPDLTPIAGNGWELKGGQGMMQFVLVDKAKERSEPVYQDAIHKLCEPENICALHFWSDERFIPVKYTSMSDAEANAEVAIYGRNPLTGLTNFMWNCRINNDPNKCFS